MSPTPLSINPPSHHYHLLALHQQPFNPLSTAQFTLTSSLGHATRPRSSCLKQVIDSWPTHNRQTDEMHRDAPRSTAQQIDLPAISMDEKKHFRFFDLSAELRNHIYDYVTAQMENPRRLFHLSPVWTEFPAEADWPERGVAFEGCRRPGCSLCISSR